MTLTFFLLECFIFIAVAISVQAQTKPHPIKVVGDRHTLVLMSDGTVVGWGPCDWGELGPIPAIPQNRNWATSLVAIKLPRRAVDIAAGDASSIALLDDGTVVSWGSNYKSLLGDARATAVRLPSGKNGTETPIQVTGLRDIAKIAAAGSGAAALKKDGTVYVWGQNFGSAIPERLQGVQNITQISIGSSHGMALDSNGSVWTWGDNLYGALGRSTKSTSAGLVPGLAGVVSIAAGQGVSTVAKNDGTVWVWGSNFHVQFGNGDRTDAPVRGGLQNDIQTIPQAVPGVRNVLMVVSGIVGRHTLALLRDGSLRGWGNTDWGQIGAGVSGTFQETPVIPKISGVKAVFAAQNASYALKSDNSLWIWGSSSNEFPMKVNAKLPRLLVLD